jgi:hypothetical protein
MPKHVITIPKRVITMSETCTYVRSSPQAVGYEEAVEIRGNVVPCRDRDLHLSAMLGTVVCELAVEFGSATLS